MCFFFVSIVAETARKMISAARPGSRTHLARVGGSDFFRSAFSIGPTEGSVNGSAFWLIAARAQVRQLGVDGFVSLDSLSVPTPE
jgi:hypothetical protein